MTSHEVSVIECFPPVIITNILSSFHSRYTKMGCFGSKDKLSKEDMDFLKTHTRYDETTIKEWYKGFKVISADINEVKV